MRSPNTCLMCEQLADLVASHVIPRALHLDAQELETGKQAMRIYSDKLPYSRKSLTGEYDRIVCAKCEARFQSWDDYGVAFVREHREGAGGKAYGTPEVAREITNFDYDRLKLFVLSMLWRANASTRPMFKRIRLEQKRREVLTQAILTADPGEPEFFAIIAALYKKDHLKKFLFDPHPESYDGIEHVRLYVYGGFTFVIKVDDRPSPEPYTPLVLTPGKPFYVFLRDDLSPSESRAVRNVLAATEGRE